MFEARWHPDRAIGRHQPASLWRGNLHGAAGRIDQLRLAMHVGAEPGALLVAPRHQMHAGGNRGLDTLARDDWRFGDTHWHHPVRHRPYNLSRNFEDSDTHGFDQRSDRQSEGLSTNSPARVIGFVNAAHFIDHYSMLIFAAAVIVMGPALGMAYSELLPYATPGFIAIRRGSAADRLARRSLEPPPHDGDLLCRHRAVDGCGRSGADAIATQRRAAFDRRVCLDLSPGRHRDDRILCRPARPRDGPQRCLGQPRRGLVLARHRRGRPISRLALGLHRARHHHSRDRRGLCVGGAA